MATRTKRQIFYWVRPESGVYHTRSDCPHLTNSTRYWQVEKGPEPPPSNHYRSHGRKRTLCRTCAKGAA